MKTWDSPKNGDVDLGTALQQECLRRGKLLLHSEAMGKVYIKNKNHTKCSETTFRIIMINERPGKAVSG